MQCIVFGGSPQRLASCLKLEVDHGTSLVKGGSFGFLLLLSANAAIRVNLLNRRLEKEDLPVKFFTSGVGWDHALAVGSDGKLLGIGWNSFGQVVPHCRSSGSTGQENIHFIEDWTPLDTSVFRSKVVSVAAGERHSVLLTEGGSVWTWGCNLDGQLGLGGGNAESAKPCCVFGPGSSNPKVARHEVFGPVSSEEFLLTLLHQGGAKIESAREVACGSRHCYVVTDRGEAWGWGWSLHGQCASVDPAVESPTPATALYGLRVVSVAAGMAHTLAVTETGDVYSWGCNEDGQLGVGDFVNRTSPELVEDLGGEELSIKKVSCGARHSVALTESGRVLGCGWSGRGALGTRAVKVAKFEEVSVTGTVRDAECGWWHTALLLDPSPTS